MGSYKAPLRAPLKGSYKGGIRDPIRGGSWVVISRVISRVTIAITYIRGLLPPPMNLQVGTRYLTVYTIIMGADWLQAPNRSLAVPCAVCQGSYC